MSHDREKSPVEDWSHSIAPGMPTFGAFWHRQVTFEKLGHVSQVGRQTHMVHLGTHSGTHVDAPSHFLADGRSISDFPVDCIMGKILVIKVQSEQFSAIDADHKLFGELENHSNLDGLVLNFGWAAEWGSEKYFSAQPYLLKEAASRILSSGVKFLGYDLAMPDNPTEGRSHEEDSQIHKMFLKENVLLVENLNIPTTATGVYRSLSVPLKVMGLDGAPVRFIVER